MIQKNLMQLPKLVSIPDRYAKNFLMSPGVIPISSVSIPDRYAKNNNKRTGEVKRVVFQFLIGTLKTPVGGSAKSRP